MAEHQRNEMQSEARIDPAARQGMRRFLASVDADTLTDFIRDCLRAVDRKVAVAIFNDNVHGLPMPGSSDRGRIASVLRGVLRAGRPDAFECLQGLTSQHLDEALNDDQHEAYGKAVDALNEGAEAGDAAKIGAAAGEVVQAMRAGMDDAAIRRYVQVHALPETIDALLAAIATGGGAEKTAGAAGTGATTGSDDAETPKPAATKPPAKKTAAKKASKSAAAAKPSAPKASLKESTKQKTTGKRGGRKKV